MRRRTFYTLATAAALGIVLLGPACAGRLRPAATNAPPASTPSAANPSPALNQSPAESGSVSFRIQELSRRQTAEGEELIWLAGHESAAGAARFRIALTLTEPPAGTRFSFSEGALLRERDSRPAEFLRQLAAALEASGVPEGAPKTDRLDCMMSVLGRNLSRLSDEGGSGFTSNPPGDWFAIKVFVAEGEGEFYLNLNPRGGVGEISSKDPEYGDTVLKELSRVL